MDQVQVLKITELSTGLSSIIELDDDAGDIGTWIMVAIDAIQMQFKQRLDAPHIHINKYFMPQHTVNKLQVEALLYDLDIPNS
jgi:hypothetical protein